MDLQIAALLSCLRTARLLVQALMAARIITPETMAAFERAFSVIEADCNNGVSNPDVFNQIKGGDVVPNETHDRYHKLD